jgi:alpha/beta superfamily hydrolase
MNMPKLPADTKPFLWGAVAGAVALAIFGFNWGGWVTGGTSEKLAGTRADEATVAALTPICVAQFRRSAKAPASLAALKETKSWEQADYVQSNGWATMPGSSSKAEPNRLVAQSCAEALNKLVL